ncbi:MAG: PadR family transcriptional regulator [Saprospiraceae bacterium]
MYNKELLKGTLKTIILKLLAENGRMYGYEITQTVKGITEGQIQLTEGALYPTLHQLEADGLVITEKEQIGKRVRKYYALTPIGSQAAVNKVAEFEEFVRLIGLLIHPKPSMSS